MFHCTKPRASVISKSGGTRTVAKSGKTVEIEGQDECLKTMKHEPRLLDSRRGDRQESLVGFATRLSFSDGR